MPLNSRLVTFQSDNMSMLPINIQITTTLTRNIWKGGKIRVGNRKKYRKGGFSGLIEQQQKCLDLKKRACKALNDREALTVKEKD